MSYRDYTAIVLDRGTRPFVLFFDLGGTLVEIENDEIRRDSEGRVKLLPGVAEKLSGLSGYKVFVVTNQAGVAEGLITAEEARSFVEQVNKLCNGVITGYRICMEPADSGSAFRKPRPGMILQAAAEREIDLSRSFAIGDKASDILAGGAAGCRTILVRTGVGRQHEQQTAARPDFVADDLLAAAEFIARSTGGRTGVSPAGDTP